MSLLMGAPVALFPAVSSLVGLIDPTIFNSHLLREGRDVDLKAAVDAVGEVVRTGKASVPIDSLATDDDEKKKGGAEENKNLIEAFLKLKLPAELRQDPSSLQEVLNQEAAVNSQAGGADASTLTVSQQQAAFSAALQDAQQAATTAQQQQQQQGGSSGVRPLQALADRFDVGQWFRNQANSVRNAVQQGTQQAQNFWLGGGLRRPFQSGTNNVNRNNLPDNYFVRTPLAWRMLVPYGLLMNFLSWATPLDIPRFLPLADAAGYLGEVANPFMGIMFLGSMFLHLAEAGVAYALSRSYGLNYETSFAWFLQTLGFGMFSLQYLLFPDTRYMQRIDSNAPPDLSSYNLIDYLEGF